MANALSPQREEILTLLRRQGPMKVNELMDACQIIQDGRELSNYLYNMRKDGFIARDNDKGYRIRSGEEAPSTAVAPAPAPADPPARRPYKKRGKQSKPEATDNTVRLALVKSHEAAQAALDEYIYSVCDKTMLDRLKSARDAAREALTAWV